MIAGVGFGPRKIRNAAEIARIANWDRVGLVRAEQADPNLLVACGAEKGKYGWSIPRSRSVNLYDLSEYLPRLAQVEITPRVIDLIPSSSWHASLANMLVPSSWKAVREVCTQDSRACESCGSAWSLECHERWVYDDEAHIQHLEGFEVLCGPCHQTRHLGYASVRGNYAEACARLAAIERLQPGEVKAYCDEVFRRFELRSSVFWTLDLSILDGSGLKLKRDITMDPDGSIVARIGSRYTSLRIAGVTLMKVGACLVLM